VQDAKGNITTNTFQMFDEPVYDKVVHVQSPESIDQGILRDTYGNPVIITQDGAGQFISKKLTYDSQHRLCRTWEPESGSSIVAYDNADNVAWSVSGASFNDTGCGQDQVVPGAKTVRAYDAMNRLTSVVYPTGTLPSTFTYDALGNVATNTSGATGWTFGRNKRGLLTSETLSIDGHNWTLGYGYDVNGIQNSTTYPDGEFVPYNPDALGRPTIIGSYVSALSLFKDGTIQFYQMGSGASYVGTKNLRDTFGNFSFRQVGTTPVLSENVTYDANGNITQLTDIATNNQRTRSMAYDGMNRLVAATANNLWGTESYTYDTLNNIRSVTNSSGVNTYNYDAFNLLSSISINGVPQHNFRYDARGNTAAKDTEVFNFDLANRLTSIDGKGAYTYDAAGRRVKKVTPAGTTYYAYNSNGQLMWDFDAATGNGSDYIYLAGKLIAAHRPAAAGGISYYYTNLQGSVLATTDAVGNLRSSNDYRPYGASALGTPLAGPGYAGHVNDGDVDLVYMQARYYDPGVGRFLSEDPVAPSPGSLFSFNRYDYAGNNPIINVDPTGKTCQRGSDGNYSCQIDHVVDHVKGRAVTRKATEDDHKTYAGLEKSLTDAVNSAASSGKSANISFESGSKTYAFTITGTSIAKNLAKREMNVDPSDEGAMATSGSTTTVEKLGIQPALSIYGNSERTQKMELLHEGIHDSREESKALGISGDIQMGVNQDDHQQSYDDAASSFLGPIQ
jgi:RHS repeat-associated protein